MNGPLELGESQLSTPTVVSVVSPDDEGGLMRKVEVPGVRSETLRIGREVEELGSVFGEIEIRQADPVAPLGINKPRDGKFIGPQQV